MAANAEHKAAKHIGGLGTFTGRGVGATGATERRKCEDIHTAEGGCARCRCHAHVCGNALTIMTTPPSGKREHAVLRGLLLRPANVGIVMLLARHMPTLAATRRGFPNVPVASVGMAPPCTLHGHGRL